jgi:hypothetical protein
MGVVTRRLSAIIGAGLIGPSLLALGSCRDIADLRDLGYEAPTPRVCRPTILPAQHGALSVRLVNAGTRGSAADFCLRASGSSDWGTSVFASGGPSCQYGLGYAQATVPFSAPSEKFDVKAIPAGASCNARATSELDGVVATAGSAAAVTLLRYGGGRVRETIASLPEDAVQFKAALALRTVNALASGQSVNLGLASSPTLPAAVPHPVFPQAIPPGHVEPEAASVAGIGSVDGRGYLNTTPYAAFGVVLQNTTDALFTTAFNPVENSPPYSAYAIGDTADATHPVRGLVCVDDQQPAGDAGSVLANCVLSKPPSLVVDTLNPALYGAAAPFVDERRPYVAPTIAARTATDLMCVVEVDLDADKQAIVQAASAHFPYSYWLPTNLDTAPTDPINAQGQVPPPPSAAPCNGIDATTIANIFQCTAQNCATPADMSGHIETNACLSGACLFEYAQLYQAGPQQNACFDCIVYYVSGQSSLAHAQQECTTDARRAPFAFDGMNGTLILSHYPLSDTRAYVLPGTGYRRVALYARVSPGGQAVDFYCTQLETPNIDKELPYTGQYGKDASDGGQVSENGWEDEQDLQVSRLVTWIKATSGASGNPAIIAGDWHATIGVNDPTGKVVLGNVSSEVIRALDAAYGGAFVRAEPAGYTPICTNCPAPANVYNQSVIPEDTTPTFLLGFPQDATTDDSRWGTENVVPLMSIPHEMAPASSGPLGEYFQRSIHVVRPSKQ